MTALGARAPSLAPGVELLGGLDASGYAEAQGLVRRGDGQSLQVTGLLYRLLECLDGSRGPDELAVELGGRIGRAVAADDVRYLLEHKLAPLGVLSDGEGAAPQVDRASPLLALKLKVVVSDPAVTARLTALFARLFSPLVVVPVLVAFAAVVGWVLFDKGLASATRQAFDSPGLLLGVFLITVLSAGWHEFGHAAACRAAGARPGAMGAGLYLVWPAFYTDVDDSYRLPRRGRLVVDLGGLYFNAVLAVVVTALWSVLRLDALLLLVASQLLLMLRQLAPVVRADGYHLLADLTGVPDLFRHVGPTLKGLLPSHWGQPQPLTRKAAWIVRAWVLVVVPLLLWMLLLAVLLLPRLLASAWEGLQVQGSATVEGAESGDLLAVAAGVLRCAALLVPVAAVVYTVGRLLRRTGTAAWSRTAGRPGRRGALVAGALAVAALLAWAWWPSGQYAPVRADERGTLVSAVSASAVQGTAFRPIDGVEPQTAYALVPRDGDGPTLLLVRGEDGSLQTVLADGSRTGLAFPFALPELPGEGDTQALAVATEDGTTVYDVAVALVWVRDGETVGNRNEAYALASCTDCTAVAVAFQVVLVVGQTDGVAPVNAAVAANGDCVRCVTTALARQLVLTLREAPSAELQEQLQRALSRLDDLASLPDPWAAVQAVEAEVTTLLSEAGLLEQTAGASATAAATPTPAPSASASPSRRASAAPTPTRSRSASPTPSASRSASPRPTATRSATAAPAATRSSTAGTSSTSTATASPSS